MAYNTKTCSTTTPALIDDEPEIAIGGCGRPHVAVTSALIGIQAKMSAVDAPVESMCVVVNILICALMAAAGLTVTADDVHLLKPGTLRRKCLGEKYKVKGQTRRGHSIMNVAWNFLCKTPAARKANLEKVLAKAKAYGCGELVTSLAKIASDIVVSKSALIKVLNKAEPKSAAYQRALMSLKAAVAAAAAVEGLALSPRDLEFLGAKGAAKLGATRRASETQGTPVQPSLDAEDAAPVQPSLGAADAAPVLPTLAGAAPVLPTLAGASQPTAVPEAMAIDVPVQFDSNAAAAEPRVDVPAWSGDALLADLDSFTFAVFDAFDEVSDLLPVDILLAESVMDPDMFPEEFFRDVAGPAPAPSRNIAN